MQQRFNLVALTCCLAFTISAQRKWDIDSIYLAEFGRDTIKQVNLPSAAVHVNPIGPLLGMLGARAEVRLTQNKSILIGLAHTSYFYQYGQPNVPERSLLLNHYGSYIYEEWIFENVLAVDLRHYWTKKTRSGQYKTRYVAVLNRFALTRWDYTTAIISNALYTSSDDDVWNGASPWIPLDFDDLRPRYENSYRFGLAYGRRYLIPVKSAFKYHEFGFAGILRYDRWREQTLLIPQLKWTLIY